MKVPLLACKEITMLLRTVEKEIFSTQQDSGYRMKEPALILVLLVLDVWSRVPQVAMKVYSRQRKALFSYNTRI